MNILMNVHTRLERKEKEWVFILSNLLQNKRQKKFLFVFYTGLNAAFRAGGSEAGRHDLRVSPIRSSDLSASMLTLKGLLTPFDSLWTPLFLVDVSCILYIYIYMYIFHVFYIFTYICIFSMYFIYLYMYIYSLYFISIFWLSKNA